MEFIVQLKHVGREFNASGPNYKEGLLVLSLLAHFIDSY